MSRRRNRGRSTDNAQPAARPQLPPLSAPIVLDRSRAEIRHMRILARLGRVTTETEIAQHLDDIIDLLDTIVVGGIDTNITLFQELLHQPDILSGDYNIHWLERWMAANAG